MKLTVGLIMIVSLFLAHCSTNEFLKNPDLALARPVVDEYFGTKITDPYRYMENLQDTVVQKWVKRQAEYSRNILNSIPGRQKLINMMLNLDKRKTTLITSLNITDGDRYFYLKTTPEDETGKLFFRDGFEGKEVLLFDPKFYANDSTIKYSVVSINPCIDGSLVSIDISPNGSETAIKLIINVETKTLFPEKIYPCFGGLDMSWMADNKCFFYNRLQNEDVNDKNHLLDSKVFLHVVGADPNNDREVFSRINNPDIEINPEDIPFVYYDKNSELLLASVWRDNNLIYYYSTLSELKNDKILWKSLTKTEDQVYNVYLTDKDLYAYSSKDAPNFRVLKTSLKNPDLYNAEIIIPEDPERKLTAFGLSKEGLYYVMSENGVREKLFIMPFDEKTGKEINLTQVAGSVRLRTKGFNYDDVWVNLSGWLNDNQRYRYNSQNNTFIPENLSTKSEYPEYADLIVEELMVPSHDGIKVPLSLIYKKDIKKDGKNPVFIQGYGAYGVSFSPGFNPNRLIWPYNGGIMAIAHVRGGGELGDQWYKAGFKATKPNTWKDLIACAEYMVKEQYTSPRHITISGGSAGGILIGRALTERPDLFAAAIPEVGILNSLRYEATPNGPGNIVEFGSVKDSIECLALIEMDSYLHVKDGVKYPATLITAGMNDPRVIAWQPAKFAARLQVANTSDKPILLLVDYEAGHGIGDTKSKVFRDYADIYCFAFWQTGHPNYQIK
jgi:prolyl oligopeptidase